MYVEFNPNPASKRVGDCVVRALSLVTGESWKDTYFSLVMLGLEMSDMPSANHVWGAYLKDRGFVREAIPNMCPDCYTVREFCMDHPQGIFVLATGSHVVAVLNGKYYDSWDSGSEIPIYYWRKEY